MLKGYISNAFGVERCLNQQKRFVSKYGHHKSLVLENMKDSMD